LSTPLCPPSVRSLCTLGSEPANMAALSMFSLEGKIAVVTGGSGTLGGEIAKGLASAGATVIILGRRLEKGEEMATVIEKEGGKATAMAADVTKREDLERVREKLMDMFGTIDILVNAAGGNVKEATLSPGGEVGLFDMPQQALQTVVDLNLMGTILPTQVFGQAMHKKGGSVINISSATAEQAVTRVVGYSAAKAAVNNFTKWVAVTLAQDAVKEGKKPVRVNALAPGFFIADQNRALLTDLETGKLTQRGETIVAKTPMGRFGEPDELIGAAIWLASDASKFVTGTVVDVDGGFGAFSGV